MGAAVRLPVRPGDGRFPAKRDGRAARHGDCLGEGLELVGRVWPVRGRNGPVPVRSYAERPMAGGRCGDDRGGVARYCDGEPLEEDFGWHRGWRRLNRHRQPRRDGHSRAAVLMALDHRPGRRDLPAGGAPGRSRIDGPPQPRSTGSRTSAGSLARGLGFGHGTGHRLYVRCLCPVRRPRRGLPAAVRGPHRRAGLGWDCRPPISAL